MQPITHHEAAKLALTAGGSFSYLAFRSAYECRCTWIKELGYVYDSNSGLEVLQGNQIKHLSTF